MMTLSGIGYVILNEQKIPPASSNAPTEANGIHVFVTKANVLALPVGSEIIVAHAHVTVRPLRGTSVQAEEAVASAQQ
jgi:hypothetical protein